jgi:hypothetical protein
MLKSGSTKASLFALVVAILMSFGLFVAWPFTVDDAFISFRYARNLASGDGLVWNPGTMPVEGYTNFLWVLVCSTFELLFGASELPAKIIGVIFLFLVLTFLCFSLYDQSDSTFVVILGIFPIIVNPSTYYHAVSGLETMMYTFFCLFLFELSRGEFGESDDWKIILIPVVGFLMGLTRPEGLLPAVVSVFYVLFKTGSHVRRKLITYIGLLSLPSISYMAWRITYFGYLLPNTFYAKTDNSIASTLLGSFRWIIDQGSILSVLLLLLLVLGLRAGKKVGFKVLFISSIITPYLILTPSMDYLARFSYACVPVLIASTFPLLGKVTEKNMNWIGVSGSISYTLALFGLISFSYLHVIGNYGYALDNVHIRIGKTLSKTEVKNDEKTLALMDAGAIPYYSHWYSYDLLGLNSEYISHGGSVDKLVKRSKPSLLILNSDRKGETREKYDSITASYSRVSSFRWVNYYVNVYVNKDLDNKTKLKLKDKIKKAHTLHKKFKTWGFGYRGLLNHTINRLTSLV